MLRNTYRRHQPYSAIAFADFLSTVASAKNMLTRNQKGTLACGEAVLVNAVVIISNAVGVDTDCVFTTPAINHSQYPVVRSILHHLGLPYTAGPLCPVFTAYFYALAAATKFPRASYPLPHVPRPPFPVEAFPSFA